MFKNNSVYLLLENGKCFKADTFGSTPVQDVCSEIVFTTSALGYLETMTDPNYYGQMVVQTFPLAGNYGTIPEDFEADKPYVSAYIVREFCKAPSNFRNQYPIEKFLNDNNITALCNVDTRSLTKEIRSFGKMRAIILKDYEESSKDKLISEIKNFKIKNAIESVSVKEEKTYCDNRIYKVAVLDFGCKKSTIKELISRNCDVVVLPYNTKADRIKELNVNGIVLSEGPGNPADYMPIAENIKQVQELNIPMFAIGMGHQLLALANGAKTEALKYGHRGSSQPVRDLLTNKVYVTAQNHGYTVSCDSLQSNMQLSFKNINDNSCEGINYLDKPCFSVQFEATLCAGISDSKLLFEKFISMIKEEKSYAAK